MREDRNVLVLCLGISLLFWFFVKLSQPYEVDRDILLEYDLPPETAFINKPPERVKARLKGNGWDLLGMYFDNQAQIRLQASNQFSGRVNENLLISKTLEQLSKRGIQVLRVENEQIDLRYEEAAAKVVPIRLRVSLDFESEHHLRGPLVIQPDSVKVYGPSSIVNALTEWPSDSIQLTDLRSDLEMKANLLQPSTGSIILDPPEVALLVPVEAFVEKSFFVPISIRDSLSIDSIRIFPPSVRVNAVVGMSQYDSLQPDDFVLEAILDGVEINSSNNTAPIQMIRQPAYVRNVRFAPQSVEFILTVQDSLPESN